MCYIYLHIIGNNMYKVIIKDTSMELHYMTLNRYLPSRKRSIILFYVNMKNIKRSHCCCCDIVDVNYEGFSHIAPVSLPQLGAFYLLFAELLLLLTETFQKSKSYG